MAKIKEITDDYILFEDDNKITYDHEQDWCEWNYADFSQLDDLARHTDFDTKNLKFESVDEAGFRFGNENRMFFVPCYSVQNGYYTSYIEIYYNGEKVLGVFCEEQYD